MKNITLIIGAITLAVNILLGMIFTSYPNFNVCLNCGVIVATTALLYIMKCITLKDAFYISLSGLFITIGVIQFALGLFAPQRVENNWYLIIVILLVAVEVILLTVTNKISKSIK